MSKFILSGNSQNETKSLLDTIFKLKRSMRVTLVMNCKYSEEISLRFVVMLKTRIYIYMYFQSYQMKPFTGWSVIKDLNSICEIKS